MTLNEYAKALKRAPEAYRKLPWADVRTAIFKGRIFLAHPELPPYQWSNKVWSKLTLKEQQ